EVVEPGGRSGAFRVEPQGQRRASVRGRQGAAHELAPLDELHPELGPQPALVPLPRPGPGGDRQLQGVEPRQCRRVRPTPVPLRCRHRAVDAVILHRMSDDVNPPGSLPPLRQAQVAHTEERILAAATELFLADGYTATTLEAVARRARVGARTVYLRFGTKV